MIDVKHHYWVGCGEPPKNKTPPNIMTRRSKQTLSQIYNILITEKNGVYILLLP